MAFFHSKNILTKFRVGVHYLEIEKGRHLKIKYSGKFLIRGKENK